MIFWTEWRDGFTGRLEGERWRMNTKDRPSVFKSIGFLLLALLPPVLSLVLQNLVAWIIQPLFLMGLDPVTVIGLQMLTFSTLFALLALLWYWLAFLGPGRRQKNPQPETGGSISLPAPGNRLRRWGFCLLASLLVAVGMQYVAYVIEQALCALFPSVRAFQNLLSGTGGGVGIRLLPILYLVILGPIGEELAFRGVSLGYARRVMPFWAANLLQALLFGLLHANPVQTTYCFLLGLLQGYFCHKGGEVRYAIPTHILFNAVSYFSFGWIQNSLNLNAPVFSILGMVAVAAAVWLFRKGTASVSQN